LETDSLAADPWHTPSELGGLGWVT
jgi:hypothetical protein